ncbi:MAG: 16S rRNA (cytidine(1402)-2'-O)-methyltransferase [bacterium]
MTKHTDKGTLYLVSTPIGNLSDITLRALDVLKQADLVAAEDTRRTGILLQHYNIRNRLESYHDHNKTKKTPFLINKLVRGTDIALVSDAGTPGVSDPAFYMVREAVKHGIRIIPIPGPTAAIAALTASGLPTDRFVFEGFIPAKKKRKKKLEHISGQNATIVLYESPHRLIRTLNDLQEFCGNRNVAVCRELTKKFEEIVRGTLEEVRENFTQRSSIKGEFVLIMEGGDKKK